MHSGLPDFRKLLALFAVAVMPMAPAAGNEIVQADRVLVRKAERKLYLLKEDEVLREFPIALGKNPQGHKIAEGDLRTPEGSYVLDWRNPNSRYYLSIHISYPNDDDMQRASDLGMSPGGNIMIHGLPDSKEETAQRLMREDWTLGCIAVPNWAMQEIWLAVRDDTPIDIEP